METILGWVLNGPIKTPNQISTHLVSTHVFETSCDLKDSYDVGILRTDLPADDMKNFWVVESSGTEPKNVVLLQRKNMSFQKR